MFNNNTYVDSKICDTLCWLKKYHPDEHDVLDEITLKNISESKKVHALSLSYFDNTIDCEPLIANGSNQFTKELLRKNYDCIGNAVFHYNDLYCKVDLLKKEDTGYSIYFVKSSFSIEDKHIYNISFQKYVLEKYGLKINHVYLLQPDKEYILDGALNVKEFFKVICLDENALLIETLKNIEDDSERMRQVLSSEEKPTLLYSKECKDCPYHNYCRKNLPTPLIEEIYRISSQSIQFYNKGIYTIQDYVETPEYKKLKFNLRRDLQIKATLNHITTSFVDKGQIRNFLNSIRYPIYHLDFETTTDLIPEIQGLHPDESYPFQYSLHIEHENGDIEHKEFLGEEKDCIRTLAEQLVKDIPMNSQLLAYHASTEIDVIKKLANKFPDLRDHLYNLADNFVDLLNPFTKGYFYNIKQGGSNSIKKVMPALCPHMEYAYKNLPLIHNGQEALAIFSKMLEAKGTPEYDTIRKGMLMYCELDTLSMVEILKALRKEII